MPKIGTHVTACIEFPVLDDKDRPTGKMQQVTGPAVVMAADGDVVDVSIYDIAPDNDPNTQSHLLGGGSKLTLATSVSDRGPGRWWRE